MNADDRTHLNELIVALTRRLQKLKLQAVEFGMHCPPHVQTEIEDIQQQIVDLQQQINRNTIHNLFQGKEDIFTLNQAIDTLEDQFRHTVVQEEQVYRVFGIKVWSVTRTVLRVMLTLFFTMSIGSLVALSVFLVPTAPDLPRPMAPNTPRPTAPNTPRPTTPDLQRPTTTRTTRPTTSQPSPVPLIPPDTRCSIFTDTPVEVREGAETAAAVISSLPPNTTFVPLDISEQRDWIKVQTDPDGWVEAESVTCMHNSLVEAEPVPTATNEPIQQVGTSVSIIVALTPTLAPTSPPVAPIAIDCTVTIDNPLITLFAEPGQLSQGIGQVPPGTYRSSNYRETASTASTVGWFQIEVDGRLGWLPDDAWTIAQKTSMCP